MVAYTEVSFQPNFAEAQAACVKCHERSFTTVDKEIIPRAVITHLLSKKKRKKEAIQNIRTNDSNKRPIIANIYHKCSC